MKCDEHAGSAPHQSLMTERIRFFTGRHMTARDFRDADAYHRSFRHLHNRVLHGWGVACGLEIRLHWLPECRPDRVVVRCGLALDCCGREVVVPKDVVTPRIPWDERPLTATKVPNPDYVLLLCLKYLECCVEKVPVLYNPNACSSPEMEYGRVREGYELAWEWIKRDDLGPHGWEAPVTCAPPPDGVDPPYRQPQAQYVEVKHDPEQHPQPPEEPPDVSSDCPDDEPYRCCLDPRCPPDHCIPLALIDVKQRKNLDEQADIDTSGRPSVAQARERLTHVCWINWPHGGVVKASQLRTLKVRFDRPLLPAEEPATTGPRGINERTFVVQYGEQLEDTQTEDLDFVEYRRSPHLLPDRRTAVYEIRKPLAYRNHVIHVTLKCDFIVDCRLNAVDGDHLCGRLPSGNGLPGGTFESWFRVVDDSYNQQTTSSGTGESRASEE